MAITTTRAERADRWRTVRALVAAGLTVSLLQVMAPASSMAQVATSTKKPVHTQQKTAPAKPAASPTKNQASATDHEADELNKKWLTDFKANNSTTAPTAAAPSVAGTETERTLSAPTMLPPSAAARAVVPGTITFVRADNAATAFNAVPGGPNQPVFKDLTKAFAGFTSNKARVEMMQARTGDGSSRVVYASIGEGKSRQSYWWFAPSDQPGGWFDEYGKRLGGAALVDPKPGARISSPFGTRRYYGRVTSSAFHNGIDFEGHVGDPIYAAADGVVNHADWYYNYGRTVKISHSQHFETLYAHMSRIAPNVAPGTTVHKGDVIGYVGTTGRATGPHLHFSAIVDGRFVDPENYLAGGGGALTGNDLVAYRQWQQDVRDAALAQKSQAEHASFWSRNPFTPPPSPGRL